MPNSCRLAKSANNIGTIRSVDRIYTTDLAIRSGKFFAFFFVFFSHPHVNRTLLSDRRTPEVLTRWSYSITTAGAYTSVDPPPISALLSLTAILFPQAPEVTHPRNWLLKGASFPEVSRVGGSVVGSRGLLYLVERAKEPNRTCPIFDCRLRSCAVHVQLFARCLFEKNDLHSSHHPTFCCLVESVKWVND